MGEQPKSNARHVTLDLDRAVRIAIPQDPRSPLQPGSFEIPGARRGWVLQFPGARPVATPAYEDGRLFVGGGYGSHAFYAFDAASGELAWQLRTTDDGPTAAVVEQGFVAFNTESCSVIVCEARTGRVVWEEWLGDPLMSQPAIAGERLFIAYPARPSRAIVRPDMSPEEKQAAIHAAQQQARHEPAQHRLLCADLRTGRHVWEQEISGDLISAPVVDGEQVFLTCLDGMSYCLNIADGTVLWSKPNASTSAPLVVGGRVIMTEKEQIGRVAFQRMRRAQRASGGDFDGRDIFRHESPYLHRRSGGGSGIKPGIAETLDAGVGFAAAPPDAKLGAAGDHLGVASVSGAWAYQGSRAAFARERIFNNAGRRVCCARDGDGQVAWEAEARGAGVDPDDQVFLPPALGRDYVYLASMPGHILSMHQETAELGFLYHTGRPIAFQPCLAKGRVYLGTATGELICLDTGQADADGWYMWGGNAQHNKIK